MPPAIPLIAAAAGALTSQAMVGVYFYGTILSAFQASIIGAVVSMAVGAIGGALFGQDDPSSPSFSSEFDNSQGVLLNKRSNTATIPVIYGSRQVGGTTVFIETDGANNEYLYLAIVLCEGEIDSINSVYFDNYEIAVGDLDGSGNVTTGRYSGLARIIKYTGTDTQAADSTLTSVSSGNWTPSHRLLGTAYLAVRLTFDREVYSRIPTIAADVKGKKVLNSTTSATEYSTNPIWCIRDYLTNSRYGRGIDSTVIDDALGGTFRTEATTCDTVIPTMGSLSSVLQYTCNGIVDPSDNDMDAVSKLLSSCRGMLIFSGGKYKIVIDKEVTPTSFEFSEDNIVGSWNISLGSKTNTYNRMRVNFFNPDRSWQSDIIIHDNTTYRTLDNELLLEREIYLPFTSNRDRAIYIAEQNLRQSRQQISVEFTATIAGTRAEVGDVVPITHSTPGWGSPAKNFRILGIRLKNDDEVVISAREYDATVYATNTVIAGDATPNTNLPNAYSVSAPTNLEIIESLYITRDGLGVKARGKLQWSGSADYYQVEYKRFNSTNYTVLQPTRNESIEIDDLASISYNFRVKAINGFGISSSYSALTQGIIGLSAAPDDVKDFRGSIINNSAHFSWNLTNDLDVRLGGKVRIRHTPKTTSQTWSSAVDIGTTIPGNATNGVLPLISGTYLAKFVDSTGNESNSASQAVFSNVPNMLNWNVVTTLTEQTTFTGTKTNMSVTGSILEFTSMGTHVKDHYNGNHGLLVGTPTFVAGINGTCVTLNGTTDYIDAGTSDEFNFTSDNFSIAFWVYHDTTGTIQRLINRGTASTNGWEVFIDANDKINVSTNQAAATQTTISDALTLDDWNHVAITRSADAIIIYIDSISAVDTIGIHDDPLTISEDLLFGVAADKTSNFLNGKLDEIFFFHTALNSYDVENLYNLKSTVAAPFAYYDCSAFTFGTYEFPVSPNSYEDIGSVQICRLTSDFEITANNIGSTIDDRTTLVDTWLDWDDTAGFTDITGKLLISTTNDDPSGSPTWSDWQQFFVGDYSARAFKFKVEAGSEDTSHQIQINTLAVEIDMPDRTDGASGISSSSSATTSISFTNTFKETPAITVVASDLTTGDYVTISNESSTGFDVDIYDSAPTPARIVKTFNWMARGY